LSVFLYLEAFAIEAALCTYWLRPVSGLVVHALKRKTMARAERIMMRCL
jgi:hypothetical protein